jgi:hypothetical protein
MSESPTSPTQKLKKKPIGKPPPPVRSPPTVGQHTAAQRTQAIARGYLSRKHDSDYYQDKETVKVHASATVEWLQARAEEESMRIMREKRHFFDYWKKYDGDDSLQPIIDLGDILMPWVCIFSLSEDAGGELTHLSYECVEICQRCWSAGLYIEGSVTSTGKEIMIKIGAPYEILAKVSFLSTLYCAAIFNVISS